MDSATIRRSVVDGTFADDLRLAVQPIVELDSSRPSGAEAFIRWQTDVGVVPPVAWLPIAAETGRLVDAVAAVRSDLVAASAALSGTDLGLSVNVTGAMIVEPGCRELLDGLGAAMSCPLAVELHVAEFVCLSTQRLPWATAPVGALVDACAAVRSNDVRLWLDDLDAVAVDDPAWASVAWDVVKLDRSVLVGGALAAVATTVRATHAGPVVVEAVESAAHVAAASAAGCTHAQGFFYGAPQPVQRPAS